MSTKEYKDISLDRIIFFSDAVFAIAITILALEIRLPEDTSDLTKVLPQLFPKILAFIFGFLQVAIFWVVHHTMFKKLISYDAGVIWLNFLFLMIIAFLPVPVAILIKLGITTGAIIFIYACLAILGVVELVIWKYITKPERALFHSTMSLHEIKLEQKKIITVMVMFLIGIGIALLNPYDALIIGIVIPFIHRLIERRSISKNKHR